MKGQTHNVRSLEGNGLSVSRHPQAWQEIARLGGNPTWSLHCVNEEGVCEGVSFLDVHALDSGAWSIVTEWGKDKGYVDDTELIVVGWHDDEVDQRMSMQFDLGDVESENPQASDRHRAQIEREAYAEYEDRIDLDATLERSRGLRATAAMVSRIGFPVEASLVRDLLLTLYVEDVMFDSLQVHGVWWQDTLDPASYSAPRGVIHSKALPRWKREVVEQAEADLSELGDGLEASFSYEAQHMEAFGETGFWGRQAAGCLILARQTGRLLLAHRSSEVLEPGTWGTWGGAMDGGETPVEAVTREIREETGYAGEFLVHPLAVFEHASGFRYHNMLAVVESEFEPECNWENQGGCWVDLEDLLGGSAPTLPLHPGMHFLLKQSGAQLRDAVHACELLRDIPQKLASHRCSASANY